MAQKKKGDGGSALSRKREPQEAIKKTSAEKKDHHQEEAGQSEQHIQFVQELVERLLEETITSSKPVKPKRAATGPPRAAPPEPDEPPSLVYAVKTHSVSLSLGDEEHAHERSFAFDPKRFYHDIVLDWERGALKDEDMFIKLPSKRVLDFLNDYNHAGKRFLDKREKKYVILGQ